MSETRIQCPPALDQQTGQSIWAQVRHIHLKTGASIVLDFSQTETMDTSGGAWLVAIGDHVRSHKGSLRWEGQHGTLAEFLDLFEPGLKADPQRHHRTHNPLERLGEIVYKAKAEIADFYNLLVEAAYWTTVAPFEGKGFRWGLFLDEMHEMGVRAVGINCLMNFMLGLVIAMLSAAQLRLVGLDIYVSHLVVIAFARELAPLMTATVVAARTGAAITAELATMKVQEEIDALRGMGLNVSQFLVAPKILALLVCMPCLVSLGMISGILGGAAWGVFVMDFDSQPWFRETLYAANLDDFFQGYAKCLCYAAAIVLIGCHNGLRVEGGSRGVGLMTTRAVVMDTFFIVLIDMVFAAVFYYVF